MRGARGICRHTLWGRCHDPDRFARLNLLQSRDDDAVARFQSVPDDPLGFLQVAQHHWPYLGNILAVYDKNGSTLLVNCNRALWDDNSLRLGAGKNAGANELAWKQ